MRDSVDALALRDALGPGSRWLVEVHASVGSTNAEALADPSPWRVVVADHQRAGRGRLQRRWEAPPRSSVAVSVVLPLDEVTSQPGWLPLLTGMAMHRAVASLTVPSGSAALGDRVALKWPNDLLARETPAADAPWRKLCGVLCELVPARSAAVCGAGINVDQDRGELPVPTATSLALCGVPELSREQLLAAYLQYLLDGYDAWRSGEPGLERVRTAYRRACLTIGQQVRVHRPGAGLVRGRAVEVDDEGRLVVDTPEGRRAHAAGDVEHVRPEGMSEAAGTAR